MPPATPLAFRLAASSGVVSGPSSALRSVAALAFAGRSIRPTTSNAASLRRAYHASSSRLATLPPKTDAITPLNPAEAHIQPRVAAHYPDSYTGPTHLVSQPPKAGYGELGKGWTGKDYSKGPSALDKAAQLFFFTEYVRLAFWRLSF